MIIDAHNHADWHKHDLARTIENMDKYRIDKTWILTWISPQDEFDPNTSRVLSREAAFGGDPVSFERCLRYKQAYPERFVLGYAPDPRREGAIDSLRSAIDMFGVKVCGELKLRMMLDDFDAVRMFRFCGQAGLPVTVHIDYEFPSGYNYPRPNWWYGGGIEALERALQKCPDTIFLGHAPGFWAHISGDGQFDKVAYPTGPVLPGGKLIEMLDRYPNLYCDISAGSGCNALKRDPAFGRDFLLRYQDRVLYARDYFDNVHQEFIDSLALPPEALNKIYFKNALRLTGDL